MAEASGGENTRRMKVLEVDGVMGQGEMEKCAYLWAQSRSSSVSAQFINPHIFIIKAGNNPRDCGKRVRPCRSVQRRLLHGLLHRVLNYFFVWYVYVLDRFFLLCVCGGRGGCLNPLRSAGWSGRVWIRQEESLPQQQPPCAFGDTRAVSAQGR